MSYRPLQLALRELHGTFTEPRALAVILGVGLIVGLTGPFGTFEALDLPPRVIYWLVVAFGTFAAGLFGATLLQETLLPGGKPFWLKIVLLALGASIPVTGFVVALNMAILPGGPFSGRAVVSLYFYCFLICLALMVTIEGIVVPAMAQRDKDAPQDAQQETPPPILDRLPPEVRGPLHHLSMADHYVEVHTARGKHLVLMRLSDAIAETRGVEGYQIHRSHWVARDAIAALTRESGRPVIALTDGTRLPVSRTFLSPLRAALDAGSQS